MTLVAAALGWTAGLSPLLVFVNGLVAIAFGIIALAWPGGGALALVVAIAAYASVYGVLVVVLAFRLRGLARDVA